MTIIEIKKKFYYIPTEWNELTAEQLLQVVETVELKDYDSVQVLLKIFKILTDITYKRWFGLKAEDVEEYVYLVNFIFKSNGLTRQLIPVYENLYGPSDEIGNMLMNEFVFSEHYYMAWQEKKDDIALLDNLVAVLYRPAKKDYDFEMNPDGDSRLLFNENVCAYYAQHIVSKWPMKVKLAIATWYGGCRQKIVDDNPDVFGGAGEAAKYGLISIIRSIAKEGVHGDFDSVEKKAVNMIMIELNEVVEEGKKLEALTKKTNG